MCIRDRVSTQSTGNMQHKAIFLFFGLLISVSYACNNGIVAGTVNFYNGSNAVSDIIQSGGTRYGGISVSGNTITIKHNTRSYFGVSSCPGSFDPSVYLPFYLLDKTLSFDVDLSQASCGCNAALYLVSMPAYGSNQRPDATTCGDYYCDANHVCGIYCPEMDIMEANTRGLHITPHKCNPPTGKYYSYCDGGGCSISVYQQDSSAYGFGTNYRINTQEKFTLSISFQTQGGNLQRIVSTLTQNGRSVQMVHDESRCGNGYLSSMTEAFRQGMVIVMSYWGESGTGMSWLDVPPCNANENCNTNTQVSFGNVQVR
eukprot:TRINITY_DN635_c0_g1_i1.p1 TRINITY_DN635_c0_g1~~TRINITY_DN635_c0_g1_i1.p1  ORF type:complete len:315 (-),score=61.11 TRINITY_DN635_c0_g1_i1:34-978(-)